MEIELKITFEEGREEFTDKEIANMFKHGLLTHIQTEILKGERMAQFGIKYEDDEFLHFNNGMWQLSVS